MPTDEKEEDTMVDVYDREHGSYDPNVKGTPEENLPTAAFPMAPKAPPFKLG